MLNLVFIVVFFVFNGAQISDDWVKLEPPRVGAKLEMPSMPFFDEAAIKPVENQPEILLRSRTCLLEGGRSSLTFVYHDEQKIPANRNQVNAVLDGAVTGAIALVNGELITEDDFFVKSHKGRDFLYRCELDDAKLQTTHKIKIRTRILLVRNRLFSLNYVAEDEIFDNKIAERFFDSFELVKTFKDRPPKPRRGRARELAQKKSEEQNK